MIYEMNDMYCIVLLLFIFYIINNLFIFIIVTVLKSYTNYKSYYSTSFSLLFFTFLCMHPSMHPSLRKHGWMQGSRK